MTEPNKSTLWIAAIVAVLLCYPLSCGPYTWLATRYGLAEPVERGADLFYLPLREGSRRMPEPFSEWYTHYTDWWWVVAKQSSPGVGSP
jgi:hypothetical protein